MSVGMLIAGIALLLCAGFLPDSDCRTDIGVVAVGCILVASLLRERAP